MKSKKKKAAVSPRRTRRKVPVRSQAVKHWLMAIDPYSDMDLRPIWEFGRHIAEQGGGRVEAVYILGPSSMNWTGEFSGPWLKRYLPKAELRMKEIFPGDSVKRTVVTCLESGQRASVKALTNYAKRSGAGGIVIATHARKGLERLAMGSFAETVMVTAQIPVMVVNPAHHIPENVRKIMIATDFSSKSEKFVNQVADYAKAMGAEVVLFHKLTDPYDPALQQGVYSLGGGWISVQNFFDDDLKEKNEAVSRLEAGLAKRDVKVSHVFDSAPGDLVQAIERAAQQSGADMVSVLTRSGTWSASLLGSVARGLVRSAHIPVLVRR